MNKTAKFDICYQGDPDLQLIRSFENATAVRLLHHLCNYVNTQVWDGIPSAITHMDKCAQSYCHATFHQFSMLNVALQITIKDLLKI